MPVAVTDKPPYRVPTMEEVRAIEPNGFTVASLFSGCGGSSLGYRMAGFKTVYANEFVEAARNTYLINAPAYAYVDPRDIRDVTGQDILDRVGPIDLLDGSPPCASFSTAGKRHKAWGTVKSYSDTQQRTDDLFLEYARILKDIQPKVFVAENVSGLVKGTAKGYFKLILTALRECGYRVEARLLNAAWLGVPQARERLIFVGVRQDLPFDPVFPRPLPYRYTVRDVIGDGLKCVFNTQGQFTVQDTTDKACNTITTSSDAHIRVFGDDITTDPETGQDITFRKYSIYDAWKRLGIGQSPTDSLFNLIRTDPDRPAPTMAAVWGSIGIACPTHWEYPRKFTLGELRRICSFPDDFVLTGTYAQRWERLGRAVPPLMMKAIASGIAEKLQTL